MVIINNIKEMQEQQQTGIVYKIFNTDSEHDKFYIGSTFKTIEQRLREH